MDEPDLRWAQDSSRLHRGQAQCPADQRLWHRLLEHLPETPDQFAVDGQGGWIVGLYVSDVERTLMEPSRGAVRGWPSGQIASRPFRALVIASRSCSLPHRCVTATTPQRAAPKRAAPKRAAPKRAAPKRAAPK